MQRWTRQCRGPTTATWHSEDEPHTRWAVHQRITSRAIPPARNVQKRQVDRPRKHLGGCHGAGGGGGDGLQSGQSVQRELLGVLESSRIMVTVVQLSKSTKDCCILRSTRVEWYANYNSIKLLKKESMEREE